MLEKNIQNILRLFMTKIGIKNWRNNTGKGWVGKTTHINRTQTVLVEKGDVVIRNARPLTAGLCEGSSDVIGITPLFITPDMVGKTVGIFTAIEVKTPTGRASNKQLDFLERVRDAGGYSGIATCTDDIDDIIERYRFYENDN